MSFINLVNSNSKFNPKKAKYFKEVQVRSPDNGYQRINKFKEDEDAHDGLFLSVGGKWILYEYRDTYKDGGWWEVGDYKEISNEQAEAWLKLNEYEKPIAKIVAEFENLYKEKMKSRKRVPRRRKQKEKV